MIYDLENCAIYLIIIFLIIVVIIVLLIIDIILILRDVDLLVIAKVIDQLFLITLDRLFRLRDRSLRCRLVEMLLKLLVDVDIDHILSNCCF